MPSLRLPAMTTCLLAAYGAFALPSAAQEDFAGQVVAWAGSEPAWRDDIDALYGFLQTALTQPVPRGEVPAPFLPAGRDPGQFMSPLRGALASLAPGQLPVEDAMEKLTGVYQAFFPLAPACDLPSLPVPASLEEAAGQVERLAARIVALHARTFTPAQVDFLRARHGQVLGLIEEAPFGGAVNQDNAADVLDFLALLDAAGPAPVFCAGQTWGLLLDRQWQDNLQRLMAAHERAGEAVIAQFPTPFGLVRFGGGADAITLSGNLLFSADLAGDDIYALRTRDQWSGLPQMLIDFAGNDTWESLEPGGYAAGIGSPAFLVDYAGDDTYHARVQTQGFGLYGIGLLLDMAGNDEYDAWDMAQGAALYGAGLLADNAGNDRYQAAGLAQGVGMTNGIGLLADNAGDDSYLSTGLAPTNYGTPGLADSWSQGVGVGLRLVAPGGVGILLDGAGSDRYTAGSFGQGGGYYFGLGLFRDAGVQNDVYLGSRYNFGWGAHMGMAYFREDGGDDHYRTRQIVSAGLAWDHSLVLFEDRGGDDVYEAGDFSLGASAYHSIAVFHDQGGGDSYLKEHPAKSEQEPPNLSLFLDTGAQANHFDTMAAPPACSLRDRLSLLLVLPAQPALSQVACPQE